MRFLLAAWLFFLLITIGGRAQERVSAKRAIGFQAVDVYIDSPDKPLAAYQLDFEVRGGGAKIVGIEGGEHPAFQTPPFYDPAAMQKERAILAAFSTEVAAKLPHGKTRVATIHLQTTGPKAPTYTVRLETAASVDGVKVAAKASFEERK